MYKAGRGDRGKMGKAERGGERVIMGGGERERWNLAPMVISISQRLYMGRFSMRKENRPFLGSSIRPNFVLIRP